MRPESVHILLRSIDDVAILKQLPPGGRRNTLLDSLSAVGLLALAAFAWIVILRHRVALQTHRRFALGSRGAACATFRSMMCSPSLPNRILLNDRCQISLNRATRFQSRLGLLMVDARINSRPSMTLPSAIRPRAKLRELAQRLDVNNCVRATDTVARIGGDEFIVLLPDLRISAEAESIAAKIVAAIAQPYVIDGSQAVITVSVGVVTFPEAGNDIDTLMRCADEAMYAAKQKGKNSFHACTGRDQRLPAEAATP